MCVIKSIVVCLHRLSDCLCRLVVCVSVVCILLDDISCRPCILTVPSPHPYCTAPLLYFNLIHPNHTTNPNFPPTPTHTPTRCCRWLTDFTTYSTPTLTPTSQPTLPLLLPLLHNLPNPNPCPYSIVTGGYSGGDRLHNLPYRSCSRRSVTHTRTLHTLSTPPHSRTHFLTLSPHSLTLSTQTLSPSPTHLLYQPYTPAIHKHAVITAGGGKGKGNQGNVYQRSLQKTITYKPPLHADEIGLTSDKYITLNETVSWLPLKISYAPMALQRWLLMTTMEDSLQVTPLSVNR